MAFGEAQTPGAPPTEGAPTPDPGGPPHPRHPLTTAPPLHSDPEHAPHNLTSCSAPEPASPAAPGGPGPCSPRAGWHGPGPAGWSPTQAARPGKRASSSYDDMGSSAKCVTQSETAPGGERPRGHRRLTSDHVLCPGRDVTTPAHV